MTFYFFSIFWTRRRRRTLASAMWLLNESCTLISMVLLLETRFECRLNVFIWSSPWSMRNIQFMACSIQLVYTLKYWVAKKVMNIIFTSQYILLLRIFFQMLFETMIIYHTCTFFSLFFILFSYETVILFVKLIVQRVCSYLSLWMGKCWFWKFFFKMLVKIVLHSWPFSCFLISFSYMYVFWHNFF